MKFGLLISFLSRMKHFHSEETVFHRYAVCKINMYLITNTIIINQFTQDQNQAKSHHFIDKWHALKTNTGYDRHRGCMKRSNISNK